MATKRGEESRDGEMDLSRGVEEPKCELHDTAAIRTFQQVVRNCLCPPWPGWARDPIVPFESRHEFRQRFQHK